MRLVRSVLTCGSVGFLAVLPGCSPCSGVANCSDAPQVAVEGRVISPETAAAVAGAKVTAYSQTGAALDSATSITDQSGLFGVRFTTPGNRSTHFSLRVAPIGWPGYVIDSLPCPAMTTRADGCVLAPVTPAPYMSVFAIVTLRQAEHIRAPNVPIAFTRTGGADWFGPVAAETFATTTDAAGNVTLFPPGLYTASNEPIVGDLTVDLPSPFGRFVHRGFIIRPIHSVFERPIYVIATGPSLNYRFEFVDSVTSLPIPGVEVLYSRTAGIGTDPGTFRALSDAAGVAHLGVRALASGVVTAELAILTPGRTTRQVKTVSLATFDSDSSRLGGRWRVGADGGLSAAPPGNQP